MGKKTKHEKVDGLGPKDVERIRKAVRQVWSWSHARKLCVQRCTDAEGFAHCENHKCKKKVPKIYPDHITAVGAVDAGFLERMFTPSKNLQGLCKKCHDRKTRQERAELKGEKIAPDAWRLCRDMRKAIGERGRRPKKGKPKQIKDFY